MTTADEIYQRYLDKAIREILRLEHEIGEAAEGRAAALPTGHPLATIFLLKYGSQAQELQEGIAFHGRAGNALIKSLGRLGVDASEVFGTNCVKFAEAQPNASREWLGRELRIVQPKLVVVLGEDALHYLNELHFPLAGPVEAKVGELQRFTPTIEVLYAPDIDASLDEASAKTRFWNAFKYIGPWWAELPPY